MDGYGDPIPPGHGEHDSPVALAGRGSNVYTDEEWDALIPACALCGGDLNAMGQLGARTYFRCRDCGLDQSTVLPYDPEEDTEW